MGEASSHYISTFFFIIFSVTSSASVIADSSNDNINLCPAEDASATKHVQPRAFSLETSDNTEISADFTESSTDGSTSLNGNVIIEQHLLRVTADYAHYDKQQDLLKVSGNVHIDTETLSLDADGGTVNMDNTETQGEFNNIKFLLPGSRMKGKADTIRAGEQADNKQHSTLNNASITSCQLADPDWLISADEIRLDHNDEYGSADDVVIRFKGVPFMYTPYIEFPISDKRRSGFLFPEFGTSSSRGFELAAPWYWNIAPNQDAVITPRYMDKRGLELAGDYRYLTQSTNGELKGVYLPEDDITMEDRYQLRYQQHSRILSNLIFDVDLQEISDAEYFNDFANSLNITSQTHLNRSAALRYDVKDWHMRALVQDIKTIDPSTLIDSPYARLPQLTLNGDTAVAGSPLLFTLDSELVDFIHEDDNKTTGTRIIIRPGLRLTLRGTAWFVDPAVKFSHTQYDLDTAPGTQDTNYRNIPMTSVDAGLFFDRTLENGYQQTLEPRLYYLNVPFEEQSNIPLFDTNIPDFSVSQLFRDNRFVGGDRIGDANQMTLALTSRIINPKTGNEFLRASIGQIFYFQDRRVTLDDSVDTASQSDVIAELDANWGRWQSNIDIQWNVPNSRLSRENYFLHYKSDARHIFNIGYRKRQEDKITDIEQTDTSFVYAFNREYSSVFRWNYSLKDNKDLDTIAGIAYDSCCWSIQLLAQRRIQNSTTTDAYDNAILVQFIFKGLGSLSGSSAQSTLQQSVYGYTDIFQ